MLRGENVPFGSLDFNYKCQVCLFKVCLHKSANHLNNSSTSVVYIVFVIGLSLFCNMIEFTELSKKKKRRNYSGWFAAKLVAKNTVPLFSNTLVLPASDWILPTSMICSKWLPCGYVRAYLKCICWLHLTTSGYLPLLCLVAYSTVHVLALSALISVIGIASNTV